MSKDLLGTYIIGGILTLYCGIAVLSIVMMHVEIYRERKQALYGEEYRKCHWCKFHGSPVKVLFHEIDKHNG